MRFHKDRGDCDASIVNSTEGALYGQGVTKETVIHYFRRTLCRTIPLYFESELQVGHLKAYKYGLKADAYDRTENSSLDCFKGFNSKNPLPNGLSDMSKCYFGNYIFIYFFVIVKLKTNLFFFSNRSSICFISTTFLWAS